ncbi:ABC transporter substrate-binding protein [Paenibacillus durus]|uniref:ABC transporter substrate-binding protein n=1 Tax=Paenibacillus durus TaxID=44251 RepID=UPI0006944385|nr:ABC transporter substrate-binding protein [Paenibacillus durus]
MKKYAWTRIFIMILASLALIVAGCSNKTVEEHKTEDTSITLKVFWWGSEDRQKRTEAVIKLFEEQHPEIKIEGSTVPLSGYWDQLAMKAADQDFPDVLQMDYSMIADYSMRKLLEPLDAFVKKGTINLSDVDSVYADPGKINNALYGISLGVNAPALIYDPKVFQQTGIKGPGQEITYDQLIEIGKQLKAELGEDFYPLDAETLDFSYYIRQKGATLFSTDGKALGYENDQDLTDFFTLQKTLVNEGIMGFSGTKEEKDSLIVKGDSAFSPITSNRIILYNQLKGSTIRMMPMPTLQGGEEGNYLKPSQFFSISSYSKHKEAAAEFIDFFTNDTAANEILQGERGVPIAGKIRKLLSEQANESGKEQYNYIEYVSNHNKPIDPPPPRGASKVNNLLLRLGKQVNDGLKTPEAASQQFRKEATATLAEMNS